MDDLTAGSDQVAAAASQIAASSQTLAEGASEQAASVEDEPELRMLSGINGSLKDRLEMLEARVLKEAMVRHRWNKTRVADELGLSRVGLRAKLTRYGLERKNGAV